MSTSRKILIVTTGGTISGNVGSSTADSHKRSDVPSLLGSLDTVREQICRESSEKIDEIQLSTHAVTDVDSS